MNILLEEQVRRSRELVAASWSLLAAVQPYRLRHFGPHAPISGGAGEATRGATAPADEDHGRR
jgi:hypothetical protein